MNFGSSPASEKGHPVSADVLGAGCLPAVSPKAGRPAATSPAARLRGLCGAVVVGRLRLSLLFR